MTAPAAPAPVTETPPEAIPATAPPEPAPAATPPAAPAAPAASETPPEARRPLSRREVKAEMMKGLTDAAASAEPVAEAPAEVIATPGEPTPVAEPVAAPASAAPQPILVPLPPVLREMGVESLSAKTPQEERALRALINGYVRRGDVETLRTRNSELERREAEREAATAARVKWEGTPEHRDAQARYQQLVQLEADGQVLAGTAEQYRASFDAQVAKLTDQELQQRMEVINEQTAAEHGRAWTDRAWENATTMPEAVRSLPKFEEWFGEAVETFDAKIERGHYDAILRGLPADQRVTEMHRLFMKEFGASLTARPEVVGVFASLNQREAQEKAAAAARAADEERRIAKIKADAVAEHMQKLAAQRGALPPPNPLGNPAPVRSTPQGSQAAAPAAPQSPQSPRKLAKAAAMERTRELLGT